MCVTGRIYNGTVGFMNSVEKSLDAFWYQENSTGIKYIFQILDSNMEKETVPNARTRSGTE
jgi:hypothetical protein